MAGNKIMSFKNMLNIKAQVYFTYFSSYGRVYSNKNLIKWFRGNNVYKVLFSDALGIYTHCYIICLQSFSRESAIIKKSITYYILKSGYGSTSNPNALNPCQRTAYPTCWPLYLK